MIYLQTPHQPVIQRYHQGTTKHLHKFDRDWSWIKREISTLTHLEWRRWNLHRYLLRCLESFPRFWFRKITSSYQSTTAEQNSGKHEYTRQRSPQLSVRVQKPILLPPMTNTQLFMVWDENERKCSFSCFFTWGWINLCTVFLHYFSLCTALASER